MFDEQPDGDPHGECSAAIRELEREVRNTELNLKESNRLVLELQEAYAKEQRISRESSAWKAAVIEKLVVAGVYLKAHETDPALALNDLISWHVFVALDPKVSSDAAKLLNNEADACFEIVRTAEFQHVAMQRILDRMEERRPHKEDSDV